MRGRRHKRITPEGRNVDQFASFHPRQSVRIDAPSRTTPINAVAATTLRRNSLSVGSCISFAAALLVQLPNDKGPGIGIRTKRRADSALAVVLSTTIQSPSSRSGRHLQRREKLNDGGVLCTPISSEKMAPEPKPEKGKQPGSTGPPSLDAAHATQSPRRYRLTHNPLPAHCRTVTSVTPYKVV